MMIFSFLIRNIASRTLELLIDNRFGTVTFLDTSTTAPSTV